MNWASKVIHSLTKNIAFKVSEILFKVNLYMLRNVYLKMEKNDKLILFSYRNIEIICCGFECIFFEEKFK